MKKLFSILFMMILYYNLFSQNRLTFPEYIEDLQEKSPKKAIEWFKENTYSPEYGVNEYVFDFYRGVSRYSSFIKFRGARTEVNRAASDFRQALELPNDPVYSYKDRAFLYIGGILTVLPGDKELPARIFKYYADNCQTSNPNYATSIYWSMYLSYITPKVYETYYQTLMILSRNPDNFIHDYFSGENKSINEMIRNLKTPENMNQKVYEWTTSDMDVYMLIKNSIPVLPEEEGLPVYTDQKFAVFERYSPAKEIEDIEEDIEKENNNDEGNEIPLEKENEEKLGELQDIAKKEKTPERASNRKIPSIDRETVDEILIEDPETVEYETNILKETNNNSAVTNDNLNNNEENINEKMLYPLTILIDKNPNNGTIGIDIEDYSFKTDVSTNFIIEVSEGEYEAYISFADKLYTNNVQVEKDKYNLFSIIVKDESKKEEVTENIENTAKEDIDENLLEEPKKEEDVSTKTLLWNAYFAPQRFSLYRQHIGMEIAFRDFYFLLYEGMKKYDLVQQCFAENTRERERCLRRILERGKQRKEIAEDLDISGCVMMTLAMQDGIQALKVLDEQIDDEEKYRYIEEQIWREIAVQDVYLKQLHGGVNSAVS